MLHVTLERVLLYLSTPVSVHALPSTNRSNVSVSLNASKALPSLSVGMVTMSSEHRALGACLPKWAYSAGSLNVPHLPLVEVRTHTHSYMFTASTPVGSSVQPVGMYSVSWL